MGQNSRAPHDRVKKGVGSRQSEMADDYETHVNVPLEPAVRRFLLERRASRSEDFPEGVDGFREDRRRSVDYRDLKDFRNLAEEEKQTAFMARPVGTKKA